MKKVIYRLDHPLTTSPASIGIFCGIASMVTAGAIDELFLDGTGGPNFVWPVGISMMAFFIVGYLTLKFNYSQESK